MLDDEGNEIPETETPSGLRKLRDDEATKRKEAEATAATERTRAEAAERKLAFVEAGINPADPKQAYFVNGYQGEDLTPEAIKAAAIAGGFLPAEGGTQQQQQGASAQELQAHEQAAGMSAGSGAVTPVDPVQAGIAAINAGKSQDEVLAAAAAAGVRIKNPLDE